MVSYTRQVVAGTNYLISLKHAAGTSEVKVFKPLPHTGKPAQVGANINPEPNVFPQSNPKPKILLLPYIPQILKPEPPLAQVLSSGHPPYQGANPSPEPST